ncbi:hypothetical protein JCM15765_04460 [Paradesulfitobacterium aromaticivorans]
MLMITRQELEWLDRIEKVLELPGGRLKKAIIRQRMLVCLDAVFPPNECEFNKSDKNPRRKRHSQKEDVLK